MGSMTLTLDLDWKPSSATHNNMTSGKFSVSLIITICKMKIAALLKMVLKTEQYDYMKYRADSLAY